MIESETHSVDLASGETSPERKVQANSHQAERVFVGTGLFWGLILGLVLATGVIILVAQNTASITVSFLGWSFSTPLIVLILGGLLIGVILDELFGLVYRARRRRSLRDRDQVERLARPQGS